MADLLGWGSSIFPDRQSLRSRAGSALAGVLRDRRAAAATAAIGLAASAVLGIAGVERERLTAAQAAVVHEERANADLQDALARLKDQVAATSQALRLAQSQIAALSDQAKRQLAASAQAASSKADRIAQLAQALDQAQRELHLTEAQRVTLRARLNIAEANRMRQQQAQVELEQWQRRIRQLTADRDRAASERDQLRARMGELEQKLSLSQSRQAQRPLAAAQPAAAAPAQSAAAPQPRQVAVIVPGQAQPIIAARPAPIIAAPPPSVTAARPRPAVAVATGRLGQFERVLAAAGVDVEHLFADFGVRRGLGGPFVPVPRGGLPEGHFSAAKLAALPGLVKSLPLFVPMLSYRETSPFGERRDPFNGHPAFHPGVDLAAPYGTPVYATGSGVITYAGYRDDYGKIVEIDHGHGIVSRYGHLARYVVLIGEHVAAGTLIGYEGSTGRSTGPHVIYEIDVNGEPQDPEKFFGLARLIPVAAR